MHFRQTKSGYKDLGTLETWLGNFRKFALVHIEPRDPNILKYMNRIISIIFGAIGLILFMSGLGAFFGHPNIIAFFFLDIWTGYLALSPQKAPIFSMLASLAMSIVSIVLAIHFWTRTRREKPS